MLIKLKSSKILPSENYLTFHPKIVQCIYYKNLRIISIHNEAKYFYKHFQNKHYYHFNL